jgi:interferon-induced GTP-binding protein Mx1
MRRAKAGTKWSASVSTTSSTQTITAETPTELTAIISRLTNTLTQNRHFSTDAIIVKLHSIDSPDLTVIDLPGIVRTVTIGQGSQIITDVDCLISEYLKQDRTIILAVIPANQDIATVDILERARLVDPTGERTLGVLTKPDLIGPGNEEEATAVLKNIRKPLKLGYVMVKNRSQAQIKEGTPPQIAREDEERFFRTHSTFSCLDQRLLGIRNLTSALVKLLVSRIKDELVPMKRQVEVMLSTTRAGVRGISSYGSASSASERQKLLVTLTQEFVRHLNDCVRGEYRDRLIVCNPNLRLYTRALVIFQELQSQVVATAPPFNGDDFVKDLARQMEALRGRELPGFMSAQSFYMFIQEFIDAWAPPARMAAAQMRALANEVVRELFEKIAVSYPTLRESFQIVASSILETSEDEALQLLDGLVVREKDPFTINEFLQAHINKLRYDRFESSVDTAFRGTAYEKPGSGSWQATKEHVGASLRSWYRSAHGVSSSANAEDMSAILEAYWTLASKRFIDNACMCLDDRILGTLCGKLQEKCYQFVHDEAKLEAFFTEDATMVAKRVQMEATRDRLVKANAALNNIQETRKHLPRTGSMSMTPNGFRLQLSILIGAQGLGLQLADETDHVVIRGFRPGSPAQQAGVKLGDFVREINGMPFTSFQEAITKLKSPNMGMVTLTLERTS